MGLRIASITDLFIGFLACFSFHLVQTGELVELSNQQLIDCSWPTGNHGCRGGFQDRTLKWVKRNGVALRRDYGPYLAQVSFNYTVIYLFCLFYLFFNIFSLILYNKDSDY